MKTRTRNILAAALAATSTLAGAAPLVPQEGAASPSPQAPVPQRGTSSQEPGTGKIPTVELYMNQQGVLVRPGDALSTRVTGAVYDAPLLVGDIALAPNNTLPLGANNPACPIFVSGAAFNIGAPIGQNVLSVPIILSVPPNTAAGTYNCALKYRAVYKSPFTGISYDVGKGNQVNVPYTVRVRR